MFDFKRRVREWRAFRRLAKIPRIQVWPLYDQPEHVIEGAASLRCWCEPELETCEGGLIVSHRDRRARLYTDGARIYCGDCGEIAALEGEG